MKKVYAVYRKGEGKTFRFIRADSKEQAYNNFKEDRFHKYDDFNVRHVDWADNIKDIDNEDIELDDNYNFANAELNHGYNVLIGNDWEYAILRPLDIPLILRFANGNSLELEDYLSNMPEGKNLGGLQYALQKLEYDTLDYFRTGSMFFCYYIEPNKRYDDGTIVRGVHMGQAISFDSSTLDLFKKCEQLPVEYTEDKATETMEQ